MNAKEKYFKLLQDTKISSYTEPEKVDALRKRLYELSMLRKHALPQYLYRYRTVDEQGYNIDALKKTKYGERQLTFLMILWTHKCFFHRSE